MAEFVAVDASDTDRGGVYFNVGVVLEISGGTEFDEHYNQVVGEFCEEYDIDLAHHLIKTDDILNRVPSYAISEAADNLVEKLLQNPAIESIYACIGWFDDDVKLNWKEEEISGMNFAKNRLAHTFPIVALWKFHSYFRYDERRTDLPTEAWIDNVQGKIMGAWKYVGNEFDIRMVPHGDTTYPSLSTADIVAGHLARTLPTDRALNELHKAAYGYLNSNSIDNTEIQAEFVNEEDRDQIVPDFPYSIQTELFYPHPVLFLHDEMFAETKQEVLPYTDFHAYARRWAQEEAGCVVKLQPHQLPSLVRDDDQIVYTKGSDTEVCHLLQELNPTKDVTVTSSEDFINQVLRED